MGFNLLLLKGSKFEPDYTTSTSPRGRKTTNKKGKTVITLKCELQTSSKATLGEALKRHGMNLNREGKSRREAVCLWPVCLHSKLKVSLLTLVLPFPLLFYYYSPPSDLIITRKIPFFFLSRSISSTQYGVQSINHLDLL